MTTRRRKRPAPEPAPVDPVYLAAEVARLSALLMTSESERESCVRAARQAVKAAERAVAVAESARQEAADARAETERVRARQPDERWRKRALAAEADVRLWKAMAEFRQGTVPAPASGLPDGLEVDDLVRLCHPDRHRGAQLELANRVTARLLELRRGR